MVSMHGVPSALILRNESWVRQQASQLSRRLPSNVERADLIQVGLIAVAQSATSFEWDGDRDSGEARDAFVRYARQRVKGAMLDELRQMDHLGRTQRRQVKLIEVARERWRAAHATEASAAEVAQQCGLSVDEVFALDAAARIGQTVSLAETAESDERRALAEPGTAPDEVEARVDTSMLMRRLETLFATLPDRDRQIIEAYLGIGLTPVELAASMKLSPSRISQMFGAIVERIRVHQGRTQAQAQARAQRSTDKLPPGMAGDFDALVARREAELAATDPQGGWARRLVDTLAAGKAPGPDGPEPPLIVTDSTRWG